MESKTELPLAPVPVRVVSWDSQHFRIEWSNKESFKLAYFQMRFCCPCASCVDEWSGERLLDQSQISKDIRPQGVQGVGRYAVQITWTDQHRTGIYPYSLLYLLCQKYGERLVP